MPAHIFQGTENEVEIVHTYAFEVAVNNPELVKITGTEHDSRELQVIKNSDE